MSPRLDPDIAKLLAVMPDTDLASGPEAVRAGMRAAAAAQTTPPPFVAAVEDIEVMGGEGPIAARVYRPTAGPAPTIAFYHGGGWVAGDLVTHDRAARRIAIECGAVVVSVDYRRPPEAPFPAAFDDAVASLKDIAARIHEFGGDASRLAIAGDSAGGNLAAAAALACRDSGPRLHAQLLIYPVTDVSGRYRNAKHNARYPSRWKNEGGFFLSLEMMAWFAEHYVSANDSWDARVSPLRARSLAGLPPTTLCVAEFDPLRDEGLAFADALEVAGVEVKRHAGSGLIHGYFRMEDASAGAGAEAKRVRADFAALLRR